MQLLRNELVSFHDRHEYPICFDLLCFAFQSCYLLHFVYELIKVAILLIMNTFQRYEELPLT